MKTIALLAAAASWSAPQTVSAPHTFLAPLLVSSDRHGGALAAWGWQDGIGQNAPGGASQVRVTRGMVSAERPALKGLVAEAAYGDGAALELASRQLDTSGRRWRLTVRDDATATRLATARTLATAFILFSPQLSVAPDGSAVVAWVELHGNRRIVRVTMRHGAHGTSSFSRPVTVFAGGQPVFVTTAVSPRGDGLVGVVRDRRVLVRVRRPGASWGPAATLSSSRARATWQLTAGFAADGRATFVWRRHRFSRAGQPDVKALDAATLAPAARRWSAPQRLEADGAQSPQLSGTVLAYREGPNDAAIARIRLLRGGRFGAAFDVAPPQGGVRSVSATPDGAGGLVAGWVVPTPAGDGGGIGYAAALAPGASAFGPREQVTPNEATFDMLLVRTSAGVRAFWTARPEGTGPSIPLDKIHTVIRTALRVPPTP